MHRPSLILTALLAVLAIASHGLLHAQAPTLMPRAPQVPAGAWLIGDADSNHIIASSNPDERLAPASLTKIMTSLIAAEQIDLGRFAPTDMVPISVKAWRAEGSRMFIREGTQVMLEDLLRGIIIQSGNDASIAVAEYIAGTEEAFADMMNAKAAALGMTNTNYVNSTGLEDPDQYTTARDLFVLSQHLIKDFPEHYRYYSETEFTYNDIKQANRNALLLEGRGVDGIKTGYTSNAGYCLVASSVERNMRLIAVVLKTASTSARTRAVRSLLTWGFNFHETTRIIDPRVPLTTAQVWYGTETEVNLGVPRSPIVTIARGRKPDIRMLFEVPDVLKAPIARDQEVGSVVFRLDEEDVLTLPLIALGEVEQSNFWERMYDGFVLFFRDLFEDA